ncbi:MAG TPA: hypothetical protein VFI17_12235 [Solirubrobacterales bacterium]|nr:hypothetical protein [Solirubrobacterales bacterium]
MARRPGGEPETGWAAIRPVLVAFLLVADAFAVASLAIVRPQGWFAPFFAFGSVLIGLVWFQVWTIRHRHDDDR